MWFIPQYTTEDYTGKWETRSQTVITFESQWTVSEANPSVSHCTSRLIVNGQK